MPDHHVLDKSGRGPWIWEVRGRYLVTSKKLRPRNAGMSETRRCGIFADYPTRAAAIRGTIARRNDINEQHARVMGKVA